MTTLLTILLSGLFAATVQAQSPDQSAPSSDRHANQGTDRHTDNPRRAHKGWRLVWADEFEGNAIDTTSWSRCEAGGADWMRHMSPLDSLCRVENGTLRLYGIRTPEATGDTRPCLTGGVNSMGKRSIDGPARIDVRARFDCAQGFWPAIWLMPDNEVGWPNGGEIDIMEHLNFDRIAYQTIHTPATLRGENRFPPNSGTSSIDPDAFNTYSVIFTEYGIQFLINDCPTHYYPRLRPDRKDQFPFKDYPFYVILSAQLGGSWVGEINLDQLPVMMEIDYVRFYRKRN